MLEEIVNVLESMQQSDGSKLKYAEEYVFNVSIIFMANKIKAQLV